MNRKPVEVGEARNAKGKDADFTWHKDGNPVHQARAIRDIMARGLDVRETAKELGVSAGHIVKRLKLLELDPAALKQVEDGTIGPAKAYSLSRLPASQQRRLAGSRERLTDARIQDAVRKQVLSKRVMEAVTGPSNQPETKPCPHCGGTGRLIA